VSHFVFNLFPFSIISCRAVLVSNSGP
jgi:hypothetical protein